MEKRLPQFFVMWQLKPLSPSLRNVKGVMNCLTIVAIGQKCPIAILGGLYR